MTAQAPVRRVDHNGLKVGQAATIILLLVAFIISSPLLVALVAVAQLLGALNSPYAPYRLFYQKVLQPAGIVKPNIIPDNPEPHRFAFLVGAVFNGVGAALIWLGVPVVGWALVWIVIALANLNFWLNFCAGCWMYYQFNKLGIPGFTQAPLNSTP
ncbi:MAG: DUF4395 domain-containing protein [Anaerolineae bacterium]|nr:DUF4395 domain-containing protein [Anaerolineae bacterium]